MKICPICQQTYTDENLNFCLADGGTLTALKDDPPPTVVMNPPRQTNPNWSTNYQPPTYQNQQMAQNQPFGMQEQNQFNQVQGQDQTLATVSLVMGILSLPLIFCCYLNIPFGIAALITGYIGMNNANNNPTRYGGKGMAMGGMITGGLSLLIMVGLFIFWLILTLLSS
jgi:hypothetical protein